MKKILILVLGLVASSASFATTTVSSKPAATALLVSQDKIRLNVAPDKATATITLRDDQGHVLYSSNANIRNGFQQQFDISNLASGTYQLAVSVGKEKTIKSFVVSEVPSQQVVTLQD